MEPRITYAEAMVRLKIARRTLYNWLKTGKLKKVKVGHSSYVLVSSIEALKLMAHSMKMLAAAGWLAKQEWFREWGVVPSYHTDRDLWQCIAKAVRPTFFSAKTSAIDVPVARIVQTAITLRDQL